jgi:tyrosyl-tRNA synthetase
MYGKLMSISDELMREYARLLGRGRWDDLLARMERGEENPMELKHELARRAVERFHDAAAASRAGERFRREVQGGALPDEIPERVLALEGEPALTVLEVVERLGLTASRGETRRLAGQGAVEIDGERVADPTGRLAAGSYLLRVGRRRFVRLQLRP